MLATIIVRRLLSHMPVMANEVLDILKPDHGKLFIDMTFGAGGHSRKLLESNKSITILAVDRDELGYQNAQRLSKEIAIRSEKLNIKQKVVPILGKFSDAVNQLALHGASDGAHGVLFDLGASSMQYDDPTRGFSLSSDGPLDMRMDRSNSSQQPTAADVVNTLDTEELARIFKVYGEEKRSRKIASAIVDSRFMLKKIHTTKELANIVLSVLSQHITHDSLGRMSHPATKVFMALRMFVNNELNELDYALRKIKDYLVPGSGTAVILTFHSLEDRIVKRHFTGVDIDEPIVRRLSQHSRNRANILDKIDDLEALDKCKDWRPLFRHVVLPSTEEVTINARSRSAKLRAATRIEHVV